MTTEAKVGTFVIASVLALGSATYFVHNTQTGARPDGLQNAPALCRRDHLWSGRALWRHQGGPGDRCRTLVRRSDSNRDPVCGEIRNSSESEIDGNRGYRHCHDRSGAHDHDRQQ